MCTGGDGTLDIFDERADVFVCTRYVDPGDYPAYCLGYPDAWDGQGLGRSAQPVPETWRRHADELGGVQEGLATGQAFEAEAPIVSPGFRIAAGSPLSVVGTAAEGCIRMARDIVALQLPAVLVQEGGYLGPSLDRNAEAYPTATRAAL